MNFSIKIFSAFILFFFAINAAFAAATKAELRKAQENTTSVDTKKQTVSMLKKIYSKAINTVKASIGFVKNNPKKCLLITATIISSIILCWYLNQSQQKPEFYQSKTWEELLAECPTSPDLEEALLNLHKNKNFIKNKPFHNQQENCFYHDIAKQIQRYCNNDSSFLSANEIKYLYKNGNTNVKNILDILKNKAQYWCGYKNFFNDFNSDNQSDNQPNKPESTIPESLENLTSKFIEQLTTNVTDLKKEYHRLAQIYHPDQCTLSDKKDCNKNMQALNLAYESRSQ